MFICQRQYQQKRSSSIGFNSPSSHSATTTDLSTTTECSSSLSGCLGNVIGNKCLEKSVGTTPCISESRSNGFRMRQRRRRRPVYFGSGSAVSASPDCHDAGRRRRPVQPWHIQQQTRMSELQYQLANLSTSYGKGAQHPVTLVDSSWWPVSQPASVCIILLVRNAF